MSHSSQVVIESARIKSGGGGGGWCSEVALLKLRPQTQDLWLVDNNMPFLCCRSQTRKENASELCNLDLGSTKFAFKQVLCVKSIL